MTYDNLKKLSKFIYLMILFGMSIKDIALLAIEYDICQV
jgi:hypothetical protein